MSIKIKQGSETKDVNDVVFGTSGTTKKDVNKVLDWNGNVIWERASPKIDITGKLSYTMRPATKKFSEEGCNQFTYSYTGKELRFSSVAYTGTEPPTDLRKNTDYEVSYVGDSGTIDHGSSYGTKSNSATATIKGIGDYTGSVSETYTIEHTNIAAYYVEFNGNGATAGSMSKQTYKRDMLDWLPENSFTKTANTFKGWSSTSSGSVEYADEALVTNLEGAGKTKTLYAVWEKASIASVKSLVATNTAGDTFDHEKYKNCVMKMSNEEIFSGGVEVTMTDGTSITFYSATTISGITCNASNTFPITEVRILYWNGEQLPKTYYLTRTVTITATSDGTVYASGSATQICKHISDTKPS